MNKNNNEIRDSKSKDKNLENNKQKQIKTNELTTKSNKTAASEKNTSANNKTKTKIKSNIKNGTTTKQKIIRSLISLSLIAGVFLLIYLSLKLTGSLEKIDSVEGLKQVILDGGSLSYVIFFVIQFLQVTFIPLPAVITTVAGTMVFGPWITFFLSFFSVLLGSIFAFWLGRKFGRKMIIWIIGEKDAIKWGEKLAKGKYVFFLMMLLPGFPDDILCMLVGATTMSYGFFIATNLITRPIVFAGIAFFGGGNIIPFSGWGIPVWIGLILLAALAFYYSLKHQDKIEKKVDEWADKIKKLVLRKK